MTKEDYKEIVWDAFRRTNSRPGHIIFMRTFRFGVMQKMNHDEGKQFIDTINQMIGEGLITYEPGSGGMDLLRLTDEGYKELYKNSKENFEIAELLMFEFKRSNMKVGHLLPMRNINHTFIPRLNPVEQDRFVSVVNTLIEKSYISYDDGKQKPVEGLILQQNGYDFIYKQTPQTLKPLF